MEIKEIKIKLRDIVEGYQDKGNGGVFTMNGNLNIRPPYQREFVYKDSQRDKVIDTIMKGYPLNIMYWSKNADGTYEVMDGQQRTISACQYKNVDFSVDFRQFNNLTQEEKDKFLDYELDIKICEGTETEKLEWFKVINIAGEKLTIQELRNSIYTGTWLTDAKSKFSKPNCPAYELGKGYIKGTPIRQDYLEVALKWVCVSKGLKDIGEYMAHHQHHLHANELYEHFEGVINWIESEFPTYRKEMKGVNWGDLYDFATKNQVYVEKDIREAMIRELMMDDDVTKKSGIYEYVITGNERALSVRAFTNQQKRQSYEVQDGKCVKCLIKCEIEEMHADHITPWSKGGRTIASNCQMLCAACNRIKGAK